MLKFVEKFEKYTISVLIILMVAAIFFGTMELAVLLVKELFAEPKFLLDIKKLLEIFGFFFMILIGLELLETIKTYVTKEQIHVEIVFLVAMIAIARKVIILEIKKLPPASLLGIAGIIAALAGGYLMIKLAHGKYPRRTGAGG